MVRKNILNIIGGLSDIVLLGNLNAIVDLVLHPEIPYFGMEHLIFGGIARGATILLFTSLVFYIRDLNRSMKMNAQVEKDRQRVIAEMKLTLSQLETIY